MYAVAPTIPYLRSISHNPSGLSKTWGQECRMEIQDQDVH
jgi:hypothetical protein